MMITLTETPLMLFVGKWDTMVTQAFRLATSGTFSQYVTLNWMMLSVIMVTGLHAHSQQVTIAVIPKTFFFNAKIWVSQPTFKRDVHATWTYLKSRTKIERISITVQHSPYGILVRSFAPEPASITTYIGPWKDFHSPFSRKFENITGIGNYNTNSNRRKLF